MAGAVKTDYSGIISGKSHRVILFLFIASSTTRSEMGKGSWTSWFISMEANTEPDSDKRL